MADQIRRIKACLNGQRDPAEHPAVPVTPAELAAAAAAAVAAGAEAVHLHPRGGDRRESLRAADVGAAVAAVRAACPQTPVGVTTGLWVTGDPRTRRDEVTAWAGLGQEQRPDFASVNIGEAGWEVLVETLADAGISAEAGVWSMADAETLGETEPASPWLRIMVELMDVTGAEAARQAGEILEQLDLAYVTAPILLHGADRSCWPLITEAGRRGLATRVGLEDVLVGPAGEPVADNAELVRLAVAAWDAAAVR